MEFIAAVSLFGLMVAAWFVMPASPPTPASQPTPLPTRSTADELPLTA